MRRFLIITLALLASTALSASLAACRQVPEGGSPALRVSPSSSPTPALSEAEGPTNTPKPTETPTPTPTAKPTLSPYESLIHVDPSSLTIDLFLNAMPADIKATHENLSDATQEQKDAHGKWIVNAWKAIFSNLTDEQLADMNLKRTDIAALGFGPTEETYEEFYIGPGSKQYYTYDYSLLQAIVAFSQEFPFYEAPVMSNFWEALKAKQGEDWSKYIHWDERYHVCAEWVFRYAVDGTAVHDVPIPGVEGVVADLAVRAYYYDANGDRQTILVAMVIRLPDGTLIYGSSPDHYDSRAEMDQEMKDYPGAFQIGEPGALPEARIMMAEDFIGWHTKEQLEPPGRQAYLQFAEANQAALDEFIETGSPTLKIILPHGLGSSGGYNIFHENFSNQPPNP